MSGLEVLKAKFSSKIKSVDYQTMITDCVETLSKNYIQMITIALQHNQNRCCVFMFDSDSCYLNEKVPLEYILGTSEPNISSESYQTAISIFEGRVKEFDNNLRVRFSKNNGVTMVFLEW